MLGIAAKGTLEAADTAPRIAIKPISLELILILSNSKRNAAILKSMTADTNSPQLKIPLLGLRAESGRNIGMRTEDRPTTAIMIRII